MPQMNLQHAFPSNKFYPPHVDDSQLLLRKKLLTDGLPGKNSNKKIIVVEAQAGQGKTTLIYQFVTHNNHLYSWYRVSIKDMDPVLFFAALYSNLTNVISGFESPELARILNEGTVEVYNLKSYANILFTDLDKFSEDVVYLVFDDLHFIDIAEKTNHLLSHIIETSPPKIRFILSSRHPLQLDNRILRNKHDVLYLNTADLSLDSSEIETLFEDIFHQAININEAEKIRDITDGWIMGIILTALGSANYGDSKKNSLDLDHFSASIPQEALSQYIRDEIFSHIFKDLHKPFLKLSLLNELHIDLASQIIGIDDLEDRLRYFSRTNYFIYQLDENRQTFCFHHLFQEYLQTEAKKQLSADDMQAVYSLAADYYLEKQNIYEALTYYFKACEYENMDSLLRKEGIQLLAQNLNITILSLLNLIPEEILQKYGWLCLFAGILGETSSPQKTLPLLETARNRFISQNQEVGELLALAQSIYYYFVVSGLYEEGGKLLPRAEELFKRNYNNLTPLEKIMAARHLSAGFCFFVSDMKKAKKYCLQAKDLATKLSIVNFIASSRFILGYIEFFSGNQPACNRELETMFTLLPDPVIGMQNRLSILFIYLSYLSKYGDHPNFIKQVQIFKEKVDERLITQTIAAPYLYFYQCTMHISQGDIEEALEFANKGMLISDTATTPHMTSQLLQLRAYIYSILGNMDGAEADLEESSRLRDIAGGFFYTTLHLVIKGATCIGLDKEKEAEEFLNQSIKMAESIPSPYLLSCALMHRAFLRIQYNDKTSAYKDLGQGLRTMRENDYSYFWSWEPTLMKTLLSTAVTNNVEKDFARKLARSRLDINIDDDGTIIPLLHFTMMDGFTIRHKDEILFSSSKLSEKQRELLDLLLTKKYQQVKLDIIQDSLWPNELPKKSRTKFDTLHSRLRKTLSPKLQVPVKHYLMIKQSILYLNNCTIDTEEFKTLAQRGLALARQGKYWQAGNNFHNAFLLWKGHLPDEIFHSDDAITYSYGVENKLTEITLVWGEILASSGLMDQAVELLEKLIEKFRQNDTLITFLFGLYRRNKNPLKANELLKRYRMELERNDYLEEEIDSCISDIINRYEKSTADNK